MYDTIDGRFIHIKYRGQDLPCPPKWVRERTKLTKRYEFASLAAALPALVNQEAKDICVSYVKNWLDNREMGVDFVIAHMPFFEASFLGAGILNEVVMRFSSVSDVSVAWLSIKKGVPFVIDARAHNANFYHQIRDQYLNADLLFVDSLLDIEDFKEGMWLVRQLYQHRFDARLPTITTMPDAQDLDVVFDVLGNEFGDRFISNAYDYIYV